MSAPQTQSEEPLDLGDMVLDRYRVDQRIAAGGHSIVYRGVDERLSRPVCIKAFHGLAKDEGIRATVYEHFVQEAFALSKLTHPNTLRIYDFGHLDASPKGRGVPVQVSEYMAGGTLAALVRKGGRLSQTDALAVVCKLGDALAEAHRMDILHRDIKPQNILFTSAAQGLEPKLADFGIAKSAVAGNVENQAEETKIIAGFPLAMYSRSWAAPEQLCGEAAAPAADLYSLGLVAVFCLSGRAICNSSTAREGYEKRRGAEDVIATTLTEAGTDKALITLLQKVCAFRKADRPENSEAVVKALRQLLEGAKPSQQFANTIARAPMSAPMRLATEGSSSGPPLLRAQGTDTTGVLAVPDETSSPRTAQRAQPSKPGPDSTPSAPHPATSLPLRAQPTRQGPSIALSRAQPRQHVGTRACEFVDIGTGTVALQVGGNGLHITFTPNPLSPSGHSITLKGLSSFVRKADGRPSRAVVLSEDSYVDLINPRQELLGRILVSFGQRQSGKFLFRLGNNPVAVDARECPNPVLIDSPTHHQSFLLYGLGSSAPTRVDKR